MKNFSSKSGFTLAEMLVCLAVISVIASILIPTIANVRPNKEKTMFKKAYQITERIVSELVNDPDLYPQGSNVSGFDNVGVVTYNGDTYGSSYVADPNVDCSSEKDKEKCEEAKKQNDKDAKSKFCKLFASKLNTSLTSKDSICVGETEDTIDAAPSFRTTDGITWAIDHTFFTTTDSDAEGPAWAKITVDVNGSKKPNQADTESTTSATGSQSSVSCAPHSVDRFNIYVRADGKIAVAGACARAYLKSSKLITDSNDSESATDVPSPLANGTTPHIAGTTDDDNTIFDMAATGAEMDTSQGAKQGFWDE